MNRITMEDTTMDVFLKMADGNPGALTAMMEIMDHGKSIDPQAMLGPTGAIMMLDEYGIYGTDIYVIWSDKCNRNIRQMLMLLRAVQLGFFTQGELVEMAADQSRQIDLSQDRWDELDRLVTTQLTDFQKKEST